HPHPRRIPASTTAAVVAALAGCLLALPALGVAQTNTSPHSRASTSSGAGSGVEARRRRHHRPGCAAFCQQAGPAAGGPDLPPLLLRAVRTSRRPIRVVNGVAPVRVTCTFTRAMEPLLVGATVAKGCIGALFFVDELVVDRHGGRMRSL